MAQSLTYNSQVVQGVALSVPTLDSDLDNIQKLDDEPNDTGGLTAAQLKAEFDKAGNTIASYLNDQLIPAILAADATEEQRALAEAERVSNEAERVSNENARNDWGVFSLSTAYAPGNKVTNLGSSYLCLQACTGIAPPNGTYWRTIAAAGATYFPRPNLLDNWYFVGGGSQQGGGQFPVNQRGGLIIPPTSVGGAMSYADVDLTTPSGNINDYRVVTITGKNASDVEYAGYEYEGRNYYTQAAYAVSGYIGNVYTIDRWKDWAISGRVTLQAGSILCDASGPDGYARLDQVLEPGTVSALAGKTLTLSVLVNGCYRLYAADNTTQSDGIYGYGTGTTTGWSVVSRTFTLPANLTYLRVEIGNGFNGPCSIAAVKLEVGDTQTLARWEDDAWALIDTPPNFQQELAKCQRYQIELNPFGNEYVYVGTGVSDTDGRVLVVIPLPVTMRAIPRVAFTGDWYLRNPSGTQLVTGFTTDRLAANALMMQAEAETTTVGAWYILYAAPDSTAPSIARLLLDANL